LRVIDETREDTSQIPEGDFPVRCDRCGGLLTGLGEAGECPECGLPFIRRQRLWQTHGPEAFARPPIKEGEYEPTWSGSAFVAGLLSGFLLAALMPAAVWLGRDWLGVADLWLVLFAWSVVTATVLWLVVSRHRGRNASGQGTADGDGRAAPSSRTSAGRLEAGLDSGDEPERPDET